MTDKTLVEREAILEMIEWHKYEAERLNRQLWPHATPLPAKPSPALSAQEQRVAGLEAGTHVLVPREPTEAMLDKGEYVNSEWLNDNAPLGQRMYREPAKAVYKAMLDAAAQPPKGGIWAT